MSIGTILAEKMKAKLRKYQLQGVRFAWIDAAGRALIADDMGLGKTIMAIAFTLLTQGGYVVCIVPSSVKHQWARQFRSHAGISSEVLEGRKPYKPQRRVLILNYEIAQFWVDYLIRIGAKVLILDECHYIKNREAKRTVAVMRLGAHVEKVLGLSGTPITNAPAEYYPMLSILRPKKFASWTEYAWEFCDPKPGFRGMWDYSGASNKKKLNRITSKFVIRRLKKDVLKDLPPKQRIVIPVDIANRREYQAARDDFSSWLLEREGKDAVKRASKAKALVRMKHLKNLAALGKMSQVVEWIENWLHENPTGKLLVFAIHKNIVDILRKKFSKIAVFITGATKPRDRLINVDRFVLDKRVRLSIGNIRAMGTGMDGFQKVCHTTLTIEIAWNNAHHEQAEDRILRIGQKAASCENYYMTGKDTIEEWLLETCHTKQVNIDTILDGGRRKDRASLYKLMQRI